MRNHSGRLSKVDAKQLVAILALLEVPFSITHTHIRAHGPRSSGVKKGTKSASHRKASAK